ncbi:MAG: hypothetical protein Q4E04_00875 [Slackia piriformis]|nr:hypothetical protein [Slackia piriformis]
MFEISALFLVLRAKQHGLSPQEEYGKKAARKASVFAMKQAAPSPAKVLLPERNDARLCL